MTHLDPRATALVLIDLQEGIVPLAAGQRDGAAVVRAATALAERFRAAGAPVVLVHVGVSPHDAPSRQVDRPMFPAEGTPPGYSDFVPGLRREGDLVVLKHHWGAFTGTDLDLQLRRRGVDTVVIAEGACASRSAEWHSFSIEQILPLLARVVRSADIELG